MSARKSSDAAARIRRNHQVARRKYLDHFIERCTSGAANGVTLTNTEALFGRFLGEEVRSGYDARIYFGIKPKSGPRPTALTRNKLLAAYFVRLGARESALAEQSASELRSRLPKTPPMRRRRADRLCIARGACTRRRALRNSKRVQRPSHRYRGSRTPRTIVRKHAVNPCP